MSEHYFVTADHGHLRIYRERQSPGQRQPDLDRVESMDFPAGLKGYTARDTSTAGRFQSSQHQAAGMSIDERLPMQREEEKRRARDVAAEIETFFSTRPEATWDFAGAPTFYNTVVHRLSPRVRERLRRQIAKDLVNQGAEELRTHLVGATH